MKCPEPIDMLIVTDWYLPGYKAGGPIVSCANMVKALSAKLRLGVLCLDRDYLSDVPYGKIAPNTWQRHGGALVCYLSPDKLKYSTIADAVRLNAPRVLYVNGIFSKYFSIFPLLAARRGSMRVIVAPRGMLAPGALGIKKWQKQAYLLAAKMLGLFNGLEFHATHGHEREHILKHIGPKSKVKVLANLPTFPEREKALHRPAKETNQLTILTVARIAPEKNITFALECLQQLPQQFSVRLILVGPVYNEAYAKACRQIEMPPHVRVEWKGALSPSEISTLYAEVHLFFLPTLGENYGHAIVEALLHGIPVLVSDQTPWRQIESDGLGADLPLADKAQFVNYICQMALMNQQAYTSACAGVSQAAMKRVNLEVLIREYKAFFG